MHYHESSTNNYTFYCRANWVKVSGTKYQTPCILVIGSEDNEPIFGDVTNVLVLGQSVFFEFKLLEAQFYHHYHAYSLSLPSSGSYIIKHRDLPCYHPYGMYHSLSNDCISRFTVLRNNVYI